MYLEDSISLFEPISLGDLEGIKKTYKKTGVLVWMVGQLTFVFKLGGILFIASSGGILEDGQRVSMF